ncbi:MAG: UDP-N-acetylmuramate--L-alanine ligase [candidate division Zixibacteria bacterium]|nr:UDP-N-acetylmuramate--L-alanine ligase [candidate division Zixibacteria bacterium]
MFGKIRRLYFVGIGGAGMSGIAEILFNLGYQISGSDHTPSEVTEYLSGRGIAVHHDHRASNLDAADVVVISSAVGEDNPEVVEARRRGIPVIKRAEMLGELMRLKYSIGIAGTHGKTTTTSMIGRILQVANLKPTIIVGGVVAELGTGASLGTGEHLVAEADEYDRSFLAMFPSLAVVTNLEADHLDCYRDLEDLTGAFLAYMNRVPFYGQVVISADDPVLSSLQTRIARPHVTFGFSVDADYRAVSEKLEEMGSTFSVYGKGDLLGEIQLHVPGRHNILNALAAIATCRELDVAFEIIADALRGFTGVSRRFEFIGKERGITVVDDYAHHPTEIHATLEAANLRKAGRTLVIFQPHLFSRTRDFLKDFADSLSIADVALLVDIYPAREKPIPGVTSEEIVKIGRKLSRGDFHYLGPKENAIVRVVEIAKPGDLIITMGAGSVTHIKQAILAALKEKG